MLGSHGLSEVTGLNRLVLADFKNGDPYTVRP